jgi:3-deoxy-D-manno-octulosonate 8-phosphate phosphatase (KDO 8-P phosphatase)
MSYALTKNIADAVERAKKIKLVVLDVHGVLTDNDVIYDQEGKRYRAFSHEDGFGCNALMFCGIELAVITRKSKATENRMKDIGIKRFYQTKEKVGQYEELLKELNITDEEACFVGDEVIDLGVMRRVGFAVSPSDGKKQALEVAHFITEKAGGKGVVRELAEFILQAQGKWEGFCEKIASKGW